MGPAWVQNVCRSSVCQELPVCHRNWLTLPGGLPRNKCGGMGRKIVMENLPNMHVEYCLLQMFANVSLAFPKVRWNYPLRAASGVGQFAIMPITLHLTARFGVLYLHEISAVSYIYRFIWEKQSLKLPSSIKCMQARMSISTTIEFVTFAGSASESELSESDSVSQLSNFFPPSPSSSPPSLPPVHPADYKSRLTGRPCSTLPVTLTSPARH